MIGDTCLILDVEMELLQVGGPLPMCLYELQRLVISVYDLLGMCYILCMCVCGHVIFDNCVCRVRQVLHRGVLGGGEVCPP
jgi:hypothetical protein